MLELWPNTLVSWIAISDDCGFGLSGVMRLIRKKVKSARFKNVIVARVVTVEISVESSRNGPFSKVKKMMVRS